MKKETADKILVFLLLLFNGNNPFYNFLYLIPTSTSGVIWIGVIISFYILFRKSITINSTIIIYTLFGLCLLFLQTIYIGNPLIGRIIRFFFVVFIPYLIYIFIDFKSLRYFPLILKYIIITSIIFWISANILYFNNIKIIDIIPKYLFFPDNPTTLDPTHILFYNFRGYANNVYFIFRNCGFYWEPGAFAGTIIMTYILFIFTKNYFSKKMGRSIHFWLIIGLISTFSTTGLLILPFLFFINKVYNEGMSVNNKMKQIATLLPIIILVSYLMFKYIPTLGEKIYSQIDATEMNKNGSNNNRFGSMLFLSSSILIAPYLGHGIFIDITTYWDKSIILYGGDGSYTTGNGMFLYIAQAGIPFFLLLCIFWYRSFFKFTRTFFYSFIFLGILLLLLQGEAWLNYPLIYLFMFIKKSNNDNFNYYTAS